MNLGPLKPGWISMSFSTSFNLANKKHLSICSIILVGNAAWLAANAALLVGNAARLVGNAARLVGNAARLVGNAACYANYNV